MHSRFGDLHAQRQAQPAAKSDYAAQVMPVLGLLLLFQYTVLLGLPPFTGLHAGPGWPLLALKGWFGAHLSEDMEARKLEFCLICSLDSV